METDTAQIDEISEMLIGLPDNTLREIKTFVAFQREKQRKHEAFVEETLKAERDGNYIDCNSADDFLSAIETAVDDN